MTSKKTEVIEILFEKVWPKGYSEPVRTPMTVTNSEVTEAIEERNKNHPHDTKPLSTNNPANFLKDILRGNPNKNWPQRLKKLKITARQRYGDTLVLEFVPYKKGQTEPFPSPFDPPEDIAIYPVESLSLPKTARDLGRKDEAWLTQVLVNLRILHAHFAFSSSHNMRELSHLQMSVKTQPEIDALFLGTLEHEGEEINALISVEAKQIDEPILENQVREQCAKAFEIYSGVTSKTITAVLPVAVKVMNKKIGKNQIRGIYVCEIELFTESKFKERTKENSIYDMPFEREATSFFHIRPPIKGISFN